MAMVELIEEEVNIVPEPLLSHVYFESKTDIFKSLSPCKRVSESRPLRTALFKHFVLVYYHWVIYSCTVSLVLLCFLNTLKW